MTRRSEWEIARERIIGLGDDSLRKSYYPELQRKINQLEVAHEQLRISDQNLRTVFNSAHEAVIIHDREGVVLEVNDPMLFLYRVTRETFRNYRAQDYSAQTEQIERLPYIWEQTFREGCQVFEWKAQRPGDGSVFDAEIALRPMRWQGQDVIIASVRDITERKRADEEKKKLEMQLVQSTKMEAVGRLAGGVAHDFNNLLTVILGYGELLMNELPQESPYCSRVSEILKAGQRGQALARQLLAFSSKQVLNTKVVNFNEILKGMEKLIQRLLGEDIKVTIEMGDNAGYVRADVSQIEQVIMNLCVNARDAMPKGGALCIKTSVCSNREQVVCKHVELKPGSYVVLSVSDTGQGITKEIKERIFEPFFSTKEKGKGTGLGLSIVHGIVKQHGGCISVYSEEGEGTTFKIYLPRIEEGVSEVEQLRNSATIAGHGETVIIAEDEVVLREMFCQIVSGLGYNVIDTASPQECLEKAAKCDHIDLLITDVIMPGMNGRELADRLKAIKPGLKILYVSGYTEDVIGYHGVLDAGIHFLSKPFTGQQLSVKVREVLESA